MFVQENLFENVICEMADIFLGVDELVFMILYNFCKCAV